MNRIQSLFLPPLLPLVALILGGMLSILMGCSARISDSIPEDVSNQNTPQQNHSQKNHFQSPAPISSSPTLPPPSPTVSPMIPVPKLLVNADRLWQSLNTIVNIPHRDRPQGRAKTRSILRQQLTDLGWTVHSQPFPDGENLIAQKSWGKGDRPAKRWIVAAHYDTVENSPGADDNGTGVAALLELAHVFADYSLTVQEPVQLELIFFDLEEWGLQGSFAYTNLPEHLQNLQGAIVLEMVGYACHQPGCQRYPKDILISPPSDRGDFLAIVGDAEHPQLLQGFDPKIQAQYIPPKMGLFTLSVPLKGAFMPDVLRSDHAPFWLQNIGAVMVTDTANFRNPHYHQITDTLDTIDRPFFTESTQAIVNAVQYYLSL